MEELIKSTAITRSETQVSTGPNLIWNLIYLHVEFIYLIHLGQHMCLTPPSFIYHYNILMREVILKKLALGVSILSHMVYIYLFLLVCSYSIMTGECGNKRCLFLAGICDLVVQWLGINVYTLIDTNRCCGLLLWSFATRVGFPPLFVSWFSAFTILSVAYVLEYLFSWSFFFF